MSRLVGSVSHQHDRSEVRDACHRHREVRRARQPRLQGYPRAGAESRPRRHPDQGVRDQSRRDAHASGRVGRGRRGQRDRVRRPREVVPGRRVPGRGEGGRAHGGPRPDNQRELRRIHPRPRVERRPHRVRSVLGRARRAPRDLSRPRGPACSATSRSRRARRW